MSVRGILIGSLGLAMLQLVVSNPDRANRLGALGSVLLAGVNRFLSPSIAAIPDRRSGATNPPAATSPGASPAPSDVQIANSTYQPRLPPRGTPVAT